MRTPALPAAPATCFARTSCSTLELKLLGTAVRVMFRVQNITDARYATAGYAGFDPPNLGRSFELVLAQRF